MIRTSFRAIFLLLIASALIECNQYEFPDSPYPRIQTLPAANIIEQGATFRAEVIQLNDEPATYGFVWGMHENLSFNDDSRIDAGTVSQKGVVEANLDAGLYKDSIYYVRSYISTKTYLYQGETVSFRGR